MTPRVSLPTTPCPFCGEIELFSQRTTQGSKWGALVCGQCEAYGPEVRTGYDTMETWYADAVEAWNRRANPPTSSESSVEEAAYRQRECLSRLLDAHPGGYTPIHVKAWRDYDNAVDALIAAATAQGRAEQKAEDQPSVEFDLATIRKLMAERDAARAETIRECREAVKRALPYTQDKGAQGIALDALDAL